jgi:hypothetical protein
LLNIVHEKRSEGLKTQNTENMSWSQCSLSETKLDLFYKIS